MQRSYLKDREGDGNAKTNFRKTGSDMNWLEIAFNSGIWC
jgi:hypothetical protein